MERFDIAVIGTGPAGVSAAITAKIRNKNVILLGSRDLSPKISKAHQQYVTSCCTSFSYVLLGGHPLLSEP